MIWTQLLIVTCRTVIWLCNIPSICLFKFLCYIRNFYMCTGVYLQLQFLFEATQTFCLDTVCKKQAHLFLLKTLCKSFGHKALDIICRDAQLKWILTDQLKERVSFNILYSGIQSRRRYSIFILVERCVRDKGPKMGLVERINAKFGGLLN